MIEKREYWADKDTDYLLGEIELLTLLISNYPKEEGMKRDLELIKDILADRVIEDILEEK